MTKVAIQGIRGSYSEEAVRQIFGDAASIVECLDFTETFASLQQGTAQNAVVPVVNKIVGEIAHPIELLREGRFEILEKISLKVRHVIAGTPDATMQGLVSVRSHVEALRQCRRFLDRHPHLEQIIGSDTASSIKRTVEEADPANAAIGSRRAAELYGAKVLCEEVADDVDNWTTFYLIGN